MQKYFAGALRPDQKESWKADDGIFYLVSDVEKELDARVEKALANRDILLKHLENDLDKKDEDLSLALHACGIKDKEIACLKSYYDSTHGYESARGKEIAALTEKLRRKP